MMTSTEFFITVADWTQMPDDILYQIAKNLATVADNIRFSCVCSSWRFAGLRNRRFSFGFHLPGFITYVGGSGEGHKTGGRFLPVDRLVNGGFVYVDLPLVSLPPRGKCLGSYQGWLFFYDVTPNKPHLFPVWVMNPFLGDRYSLPPITSVSGRPLKAIFSSSPCANQPWIFFVFCHKHALQYLKFGDAEWTSMSFNDDPETFPEDLNLYDAIFYMGKLYVSRLCEIVVFDDLSGFPQHHIPTYALHLRFLELAGDLLLIKFNVKEFELYKLCEMNDEARWDEVSSLGNYAAFLGPNQSFSLSEADYPGIKANHIYFTPRKGCKVQVFSLQDSSLTLYRDILLNKKTGLTWVTPGQM